MNPPHFLLFSEAAEGWAGGVTRNSGQQQGKYWHFVLRSPEGTARLEASDLESSASKERLELMAIVRGLEALDQPSRVTLVTRSSVVGRGLRFGLEFWRENRWKWERYGRMAPIKNADLWQRIDRAMQIHDLDYRMIRVDPPVDDLSRPTSRSRIRATERLRCRAQECELPRHTGRSRTPQLTQIGRILRRLFGWCGLCGSAPSLLITTR